MVQISNWKRRRNCDYQHQQNKFILFICNPFWTGKIVQISNWKRHRIFYYQHQQNKFILYASLSGQENWFKFQIGRDVGLWSYISFTSKRDS